MTDSSLSPALGDTLSADVLKRLGACHGLAGESGMAWRPGLAPEPVGHGEVFAPATDGAGVALALGLALDRLHAADRDPLADSPDERPWLWVQDRGAVRRSGRPYRPGLPRELRHRLIHVEAQGPEDFLFALEEGLRCRDLAFVIGEVVGNPRALDMTASRRLTLAAERHAVPLWLVRLDARRDLSSARMRWDVASISSPSPRWNPQAPGMPSWQADLFRARRHPPGCWNLRKESWNSPAMLAERVAARPDLHDDAMLSDDYPVRARG